MEPTEGFEVDHINHDRLDNRRSNLRVVTRSENRQNLIKPPSNNSTGILGVDWCKKSNIFRARVQKNGKLVFVDYFKTLPEAEKAITEVRSKYLPYSQEAMANVFGEDVA